MNKGEHIRKKRKELGISTLAELADKLGIKQQSAFQWETGGGIRGKNKEKLAKLLGVSTHWVENGWRDDFVDIPGFQQDDSKKTDQKDKLIAVRIIEERTRCGYSQETLAEKTNIPISELQSYEFGEKVIPIDFLTELTECGFDIPYILTGNKNQDALLNSGSNIATTGINQGLISQTNGR